MYGIIQLIVEDWVISRFGLDTWAAIKDEANYADLPNGGFIRHEYYPDAVTLNLIAAAGKVAGLDVAVVLELFGEAFVRWMMCHGYASMLRSQGATLLDFLNSLDHMHQGLQEGMPRLLYPSFSCTEEPGSLALEYSSARAGLGPMVPGMVREAGMCLFSKRYACAVVSQDDHHADGRHHVVYRIVFEGDAAPDLTAQPSLGAAGSYTFFEQNPAMAHGWVQSLQNQVRNIRTPADAVRFAESFDLHHLAALLVTPSSEGMIALSTLFMDPLAHPQELMPMPSLGYMRGPASARGIETALIGSVVMCAGVTCGRGALVRTAPTQGYHLAPIRVLVCVVPDPLARSVLVRAFADTLNPELLSSAEAVAVLAAAWVRVRPRFLLNAATDVATLLLITAMACRVHSSGMWLEIRSLGILFVKAALEECVVLVRSMRRGWLRNYVSVDSLVEWVSLLLYLSFFAECAGSSCVDHIYRGSATLALFVFSRWCHLLYLCRALDVLGPMILPILFTVASVGPFILVLSVVLLGFLYSYAILTGDPLALHQLGITIGQMYGVNAGMSIDLDVPGIQVWIYAFESIVTLLLLNILIGVMSENYSKYQESVVSIFNRSRALEVLNLEMLLLPCRRLSRTRCLRWLQALLLIEDSSYEAQPAGGAGEGYEAPCTSGSASDSSTCGSACTPAEDCPEYLWLCMHRTPETETPAPAECVSETMFSFTRQLERLGKQLQTLQSSLDSLTAT